MLDAQTLERLQDGQILTLASPHRTSQNQGQCGSRLVKPRQTQSNLVNLNMFIPTSVAL
jgi:hypothetical protein